MSWDVLVLNHGGQTPTLDAEPVGPLGAAADVRKKISAHLPGVDWSGDHSGMYEGAGYSIEFSMGTDDPVESIMLHVRGSGEALAALWAFAPPNGWSLYDLSADEFLDPHDSSSAGWEGFQDYRDRTVGASPPKKRAAKKAATKNKAPAKKKSATHKKPKPPGKKAPKGKR